MASHKYTVDDEDLAVVNRHVRGPEYLWCLSEIMQEFRARAKHNPPQTTWLEAYELVLRILRDHGVDPAEE